MSNPQFYDSHWKAALPEVLLALLRTVLPTIGPTLTPWQTELAVPSPIRVDNAFLTQLDNVDLLIHLEYQSTIDASMSERIYQYDTQLERLVQQHQRRRVDVLSVVVWTTPGTTPVPEYHREVGGITVAHKAYLEIHLTQLDWHHPGDPLLLVLAPYFQTVTLADLVPIAEQLYTSAPADRRNELLGSLLSLGQHRFGSIEAIKKAILEKVGESMDLIFEAVKESDMGKAIRKEGEERGKEQGEENTRRYMIGRAWRKRFGQEFEATLALRIAALPQDQYDVIFDAVEDGATSPEQILARLDL